MSNKPNTFISLTAASYGLGPYHPAVFDTLGGQLWYWPNITFATETEASNWARVSVSQVEIEVQQSIESWNIYAVP